MPPLNKSHLSQREKEVLDLAVTHLVKVQQLITVINSEVFQDLSPVERETTVGILHGLCLNSGMSVKGTGTF
jgi:hypothetical protein